MIGLDTNVLVRYLALDDPGQSAIASRLIRNFTTGAPGFVSTVMLVETAWVLAKVHRRPRAEIADVIEALLSTEELVVEQLEAQHSALRLYRNGSADFADAVIAEAGRRAGFPEAVTFDRRAAEANQMRLLS